MQQKITLIGSTGLIGSNFLEVINNEDYQSVTAITRSRISNLDEKDFIKQSVHDFSNLEKMRKDLKTDVLVCALETTIKKVGSKDEFMKIDRDLPL
jgi:putative NADH-flavin reductase